MKTATDSLKTPVKGNVCGRSEMNRKPSPHANGRGSACGKKPKSVIVTEDNIAMSWMHQAGNGTEKETDPVRLNMTTDETKDAMTEEMTDETKDEMTEEMIDETKDEMIEEKTDELPLTDQ